MKASHDAQLALACLDYTRLNEQDGEQDIHAFLAQLSASKPRPAAICVYPQWLEYVKKYVDTHFNWPVSLATVTNFPSGAQPLAQVLSTTQQAIAQGANEIDLVLPYKALINGDEALALSYVQQSKALCANKAKLKVIIESGELPLDMVAKATRIAINGGADFVKTSTGKVPINATLDAVEVILDEIQQSGEAVGVKVSGGIKNLAQAQQYLQLCISKMGGAWVTPIHFRFGASSLLDELYGAI